MKKIGLALSGGGFRATLYHLGLARFLRDAGLLSKVTHVTSVSGGSIFAAHLLLHWDRYNGSPSDFEAAASELLRFIRMDVRNRITRRFPLLVPVRGVRRVLGLSNRKLTRTGLLEYHYGKYLYGDTSLFELPARPVLHILATNLSEGCLCSFSRNGLLMMRRQSGSSLRIHRLQVGLATVPMAVTASSAFPGFFPPLVLTGTDVGAASGEFGRHAYTDGGVFDNLGVRMFRYLERPLLAEGRLSRHDFLDLPALIGALRHAAETRDESPLHRLSQIVVASARRSEPVRAAKGNGSGQATGNPLSLPSAEDGRGGGEELFAASLDHALRHHPLQHEPLFADFPLTSPDAEALRRRLGAPGESALGPDDQLWLNRHLLEAAVRQTTGRGCFRRTQGCLDGVLVSDVGKPFEVQNNRPAGGLIRTALRSSDILMDRVWQLENEAFEDTPGFVFARMTDVVEPEEDPTAPHPELQRQAARVRTDLDCFSDLEISALIRHGYCIGRKACRTHPDLFDSEPPPDPPWDPISAASTVSPLAQAPSRPAHRAEVAAHQLSPVTAEARKLQASAVRRIWSTLLDYRDWVSYIYVPLIVPLLFLAPYLVVSYYKHSKHVSALIDSISQGSPDMDVISRLLEGPFAPWAGEPAEEVPELRPRSFQGVEILQDSRVIDLRRWNPAAAGKDDPTSLVYGYRRPKIRKTQQNPGNEVFRIGLLATHAQTQVRFPPQDLRPKLRMMRVDGPSTGEKSYRFEASIDLRKVRTGSTVDLIYEHISPGTFVKRSEEATTLDFKLEADTAEVTRWIFMPAGKEYETFRVFQYEADKPETIEQITPVTEFLAHDYSIIGYKLLLLKAHTGHEVQWSYK
jgi:predicted acylesterase/phospholipase RssA